MPSALSCRPSESCQNYPLCTGRQYRSNNAQRREFCKACLENRPQCTWPDCTNPCAPSRGCISVPLTCAMHYKDPAQQRLCEWQRCSNASLGCRELADTNISAVTKSKKNRLCFQCCSGALPCTYALSGCDAHIRVKKSKDNSPAYECRSRHRRHCLHAPDQSDICRSLGCVAIVCPPDILCDLCTLGEVSRLLVRRLRS